jgi:hypothetical protein
MSTNIITIADCVEYFAALHTETEELSRVKAYFRKLLTEEGCGKKIGWWNSVLVSECSGKRNTDPASVYAECQIPASVIARHTKIGSPYFSVGHCKRISSDRPPSARRLIREARELYKESIPRK